MVRPRLRRNIRDRGGTGTGLRINGLVLWGLGDPQLGDGAVSGASAGRVLRQPGRDLLELYYPTNAQVEQADGGYRISGRWSFSSGCDEASWVTLGGMTPKGLLWFLVRSGDYEIDDTWFVSGLKGTGSKDIVVDNAFVPEHRVLEFAAAAEGRTTGWDLHHRAGYRVPMMSALSFTIASPAIGLAQGAIDEFAAQLKERAAPGGGTLEGSAAAQLRLAESAVEVEAAKALMRQDYTELLERGGRGDTWTLLERAKNRRDQAFIGRLCNSVWPTAFSRVRAAMLSTVRIRFNAIIATFMWPPIMSPCNGTLAAASTAGWRWGSTPSGRPLLNDSRQSIGRRHTLRRQR